MSSDPRVPSLMAAIGSSTAGPIMGVGTPRDIRFGLKLTFRRARGCRPVHYVAITGCWKILMGPSS